jgi:alcohol dehydrogenase (cytochrome c)
MRRAVLVVWVVVLALAWFSQGARAQVPYERILKAESEPGNWLTYSGNYSSHRHSALKQITAGNVSRLKPAWVYQTRATQKVEATPLVVDGVMYISEPPSNVTALDTRTGRPLWRYRRNTPSDIRVCCGQVNRGVAILDDMLFIGTIDGHLVALDSRTGRVLWDNLLADYKVGYSITVAPLVVKDKVIIGMAGGEYGVRGFLDAYYAKNGKQAWRFWTVPAAGEPGSETWAGDSWKRGAAATWVTGSYDPELNLVLWGTGNPGPDTNGEVRLGDNLFSDCLLAINPDTGKMKWYFQFTPHDVHDWDSVQIPVLAEGTVRGKRRKLVLFTNRNGFYYVLDRETGEFLLGKAYAKQTWAKGLDDRGRPILAPGADPSPEGTRAWPNVDGANNWYSPTYSPLTKLLYVATREMGAIFYFGEAEYIPGVPYWGGGWRPIPDDDAYGVVRAFQPETGDVKWEFRLHTPPMAGLLSTAGGLVFGGTHEGEFYALDASTGKLLWSFQTGGQIIANPISYLSDGKQHVAIAAGQSIFVFALSD